LKGKNSLKDYNKSDFKTTVLAYLATWVAECLC